MLDWKILAASFVALLVISSVLVGGFGAGDFFSDIMKRIGDLLGGSPFSGFLNSPSGKPNAIDITIFPNEFPLKPGSSINFSMESSHFENFNGEVIIYFDNDSVIFKESNSPLVVSLPLEDSVIENLKLSKIVVENTAFEIAPNITTSNGTVEISGFYGSASITEASIRFQGNITSITIEIGDLRFESI